MTTAVHPSPTAARAPRPLARVVFGRGGVALLDQVLFACGNFAASILLARWLSVSAYGAFSVAFIVLLLVGTFHTAAVGEPMTVHGTGKHSARFPGYVGVLVVVHFAVCLVIGAVLALAGLACAVLGSAALAEALAALALACPFVLLIWLLRRCFYVFLQPQYALVGDAVYLLVMLAGFALLAGSRAVSPAAALLVMGAAGAVASLPLLAILRPTLARERRPAVRDVLRDHWEYARFSIPAQALSWASGQMLLVLVPLVLGLHAAATVAAVLNLFRPLHPLQQSSIALLLPATASLAARGAPPEALRREVRRFLIPWAGAICVYGLVLTAVSGPLMRHLYVGKYSGSAGIVFLFTLVYTLATVIQASTVVLKATGNVRLVPLVWALPAVVMLTFAVPSMLVAGVAGGLCVYVLGYVLAAGVAWRRAGGVTA
jgi:O-antigen/teichoic acid export membrane protein